MDEEELKKLIEKGENEKIEFKESLNMMDEIGGSVSAFSNSFGGIILIGISDKREIKGIDIGKKTIEQLANFIKQNTDNHVYPVISIEKVNNKDIILINIKEQDEKPVFFKGVAYKRVGKSNHKMSASEIRKLFKESSKIYWDEKICDSAALEDIDKEKVKWFLKKAKSERNFDVDSETLLEEALEKLGLMKPQNSLNFGSKKSKKDFLGNKKLTNSSILFFGKEPQKFFIQSEVRCARFKGIEPIKPFLDMKVLGGSIYEEIDNSEKFILSNIKKEVWTEGGKIEREEKWEYPPDAIREAITNAICHRDYETSSNVHISIFDDRIEIWNPGNLPYPLKPADLKKPHKSIPVNPLIASKLFLIKYIEKWGTGTSDIIKYCFDEGLPEPEFREEANGFLVVLWKDILTEKNLERLQLNDRQIKAIKQIKEKNKITNSNYQRINSVSERTALRELKELVEKRLLKRIGKTGRETNYVLFKTRQKPAKNPPR